MSFLGETISLFISISPHACFATDLTKKCALRAPYCFSNLILHHFIFQRNFDIVSFGRTQIVVTSENSLLPIFRIHLSFTLLKDALSIGYLWRLCAYYNLVPCKLMKKITQEVPLSEDILTNYQIKS